VRGGRRRRAAGRGLLRLVLVLVLVAVAYGVALVWRANSAINRTEVGALTSHSGGPLNFLVVGSDSREDLSDEEKLELGTGSVEGERTDSIFVLSVSGGDAAVLAFPRDLYVTRCDGSPGRINSAVGRGGPGCLVDTVESLSGLEIHHFLTVSFGGFRDIVDAIGGVDVCVDRDLDDPFAGINLSAGCQTLGGVEALGYVRTRKLDSDLERIKRQQQFLAALASEAATPATLLDPTEAWPLTRAVGRALEADEGLGVIDLARLGLGLRGLSGGGAVTATVPGVPASVGGAAVLEVAQPEADTLFASFRDGSVLRQPSPRLGPGDVEVEVRNGAGVAGLAAATRDALVSDGFAVVGIGDADPTPTSVIRHPAGLREQAEVLADRIPVDVTLDESDAVDAVTLVLGADLADGIP
jgi:LCP family protein required for cell wall assembly